MKSTLALLSIILSLSILACNNSTSVDGGGHADLTGSQLVGSYTLGGFTIKYSNGQVITDTTPGYAISGIMTISAAGEMTQHITNGVNSATYTGTILQILSDTLMQVSSAGRQYNLQIHYKNNTLTTFLPGSTLGVSFDESDVWIHTSALYKTKSSSEVPSQNSPLGAAAATIFR